MTHVYRKRTFVCATCDATRVVWTWSFDPDPTCHGVMVEAQDHVGASAAVAPDSIPGGLLIDHAICHHDGTPRRFYSKSAIREAARQAGWTVHGETPKPPDGGYRED